MVVAHWRAPGILRVEIVSRLFSFVAHWLHAQRLRWLGPRVGDRFALRGWGAVTVIEIDRRRIALVPSNALTESTTVHWMMRGDFNRAARSIGS